MTNQAMTHHQSSPGATQTIPRLGHVHLRVRSLDRSIDFYTAVVGLHLVERLGEAYAFLSSSEDHHTLALQALGSAAAPPSTGSVGLYHVAFELPTPGGLDAALTRLDEHGVSWQAVDHGISWAVYFDDPDGNGLELYVDRRQRPTGRGEWRGVTRRLSRERIQLAAAGEDRSDGLHGGGHPTTERESTNRTRHLPSRDRRSGDRDENPRAVVPAKGESS